MGCYYVSGSVLGVFIYTSHLMLLLELCTKEYFMHILQMRNLRLKEAK